jgi:hypothetical protein
MANLLAHTLARERTGETGEAVAILPSLATTRQIQHQAVKHEVLVFW